MLRATYGSRMRTSRPARGLELAQDPAVDLLHRLRAPLLDVGLHGGEERGHGDAREDQRRRPAPSHRAAEQVGDADAEGRAGERGDRAQVEAAVRRRRRRRSRSSRRARRRRRRRAGTGRRAGSGRRPGRRRRRGEHRADEEPERDAGRAQLPEDRVLRRRERRLHAEEGNVAEDLAGDRGDAEVDGPEREAEQRGEHDEDRSGQRPARPRRRGAPAPAGSRRPRGARRRSPSRPADPLERLRDQLDEDDRARAPAGRDVVVGLDDVAVGHCLDLVPAGPWPRRSRPSARSTSCRRGR